MRSTNDPGSPTSSTREEHNKATHMPLLEKLAGPVAYTMAFDLCTGGFPDGLFWGTEDPNHRRPWRPAPAPLANAASARQVQR